MRQGSRRWFWAVPDTERRRRWLYNLFRYQDTQLCSYLFFVKCPRRFVAMKYTVTRVQWGIEESSVVGLVGLGLGPYQAPNND